MQPEIAVWIEKTKAQTEDNGKYKQVKLLPVYYSQSFNPYKGKVYARHGVNCAGNSKRRYFVHGKKRGDKANGQNRSQQNVFVDDFFQYPEHSDKG